MLHIILVVLGLVSLGSGLHIDATPGRIEVGVTRYLTVNCTTTAESISRMASLISLIIYRSTEADDTNYTELDSINVFQSSGHVIENINDNQISTGVIDTNSQSYLSLVWEYPDATKAGLYKCEANGVNFAGHPVAINSTVWVPYNSPDINVLVRELRNINLKMEQLNNVVVIQNSLVQDLKNNQQMWNNRIESMKRLVFNDSTSYDNHHYYLSYPRASVSIKDFEAVCELFGGYLAEVDSVAEFNFLRSFVSKHTELNYVMTGGTEEGHEGHWVNIHSGSVIQDIQWGPNEPVNNVYANCMWFGNGKKLVYA